ncbi:hypothetical protein [uncultured Sphingomonas sp.]|uniref:hypothetical protein n=1 Tax=uncultured Sphingomonas sp. TaxID=158754 RepID=UPI0035CAFF29
MNLLLLLSALLSALGGGTDARVPLAPATLSRNVARLATASAAARLRIAASRPVAAMPRVADVLLRSGRAFALAAAVPAFASRRRE